LGFAFSKARSISKRCGRFTGVRFGVWSCWRNDLKGGLKVVERKLGIERQLKGVDGYVAVQLWWDYVNNGNLDSLQTLLAYNAEDVVNLRVLRKKLGVR